MRNTKFLLVPRHRDVQFVTDVLEFSLPKYSKMNCAVDSKVVNEVAGLASFDCPVPPWRTRFAEPRRFLCFSLKV